MKELERQFKALANRRRLAILKHLKRNGRSPVGAIAKKINLSLKATSKHLAVLYSADMLERESIGLMTCYRLADKKPTVLLQALGHL
jgi:DNA-binding transcriptional ArsR family regulator